MVYMSLKIMSYNIHACIGMDGILDPERIATVFAEENADLIGMNEVDLGTERTGGVDQTRQIADQLGYHYVFGPAMAYGGGEYGNALVSRYPIEVIQNHKLPFLQDISKEPRAILECSVDVEGSQLRVLVTHLGLDVSERELSINYIADLLQGSDTPTILIGDFNIRYHESFGELEPLMAMLKDAPAEIGKEDEILTFDAHEPTARIDYVFLSKELMVEDVYVVKTEASDHLPLVCVLETGNGQ